MKLENYELHLPSYSVGKEVYNQIGKICKPYGTKVLVIGGGDGLPHPFDERRRPLQVQSDQTGDQADGAIPKGSFADIPFCECKKRANQCARQAWGNFLVANQSRSVAIRFSKDFVYGRKCVMYNVSGNDFR